MAFYLQTESASPKTHTRRFSCGSKNAYRGLQVENPGLRFYSANLARWINRDPIGEDGGLGLLVFVLNNPITKLDYLGREASVGSPCKATDPQPQIKGNELSEGAKYTGAANVVFNVFTDYPMTKSLTMKDFSYLPEKAQCMCEVEMDVCCDVTILSCKLSGNSDKGVWQVQEVKKHQFQKKTKTWKAEGPEDVTPIRPPTYTPMPGVPPPYTGWSHDHYLGERSNLNFSIYEGQWRTAQSKYCSDRCASLRGKTL